MLESEKGIATDSGDDNGQFRGNDCRRYLYGQDRRDWRYGTLVHGRAASPSLSLRGSRSMNSDVLLPAGWPSLPPSSVIRDSLCHESPCVRAFPFSKCSWSTLWRVPHAADLARIEQSIFPAHRFSGLFLLIKLGFVPV